MELCFWGAWELTNELRGCYLNHPKKNSVRPNGIVLNSIATEVAPAWGEVLSDLLKLCSFQFGSIL